ncbi:hypothetical protein [Streptomyces sp. XD-27]|uniref:hypothetical protein n=1 Tax=Streptomyces sp. XD-27 TaxID=3062779 RepID=UPI0026F420F7|nr:hypothetical protein [Streptomyces sp. XD-27]WKX69350.1 hypothetical protein Q3Y56_04920 [Streptomyces sp. XD-27]
MRKLFTRRWIFFGLIAGAVVCFILERVAFKSEGLSHDLSHAVGEALFVAFILGIAGDFYLRDKFGEDVMRRAVQGVMNETLGFLRGEQPVELRKAVYGFADQSVYINRTRLRLNFSWADRGKVVRLDISARVTGTCLDGTGYLPRRTLWALSSVNGYHTSYLHYSLQCPAAGIDVEESGADLLPFTSTSLHRLGLNQQDLLTAHIPLGAKIPFGESFEHGRSFQTFLNAAGFIPLMHSDFAILFRLELAGEALPDLEISVFHPVSESGEQEWHYEEGDPVPVREWSAVTPGQATIVAWRPEAPMGADL